MSLPSASAHERVIACPASHALPQVHTTGAHAQRGTEIARYIRLVVGGASVEDAASTVDVEAWRETCRNLDWRRLVGDLSDVHGETAYALDTATSAVRVLGSNLGRNYPPTSATELVGTSDLEGVRLDGVPVVIDVKTGREVTPVAWNAQIRFFALVRHLLTGAPEVEGRIAYVAEDGSVRLDCHVFDVFDLETHGDELAELPARISRARELVVLGDVPPVSSGSHCRYCPAKPACPRYTALAREMVSEVTAIRDRLAAMSPEEQGEAWAKLRDVKALVDDIDHALKELAAQHPIPLPNGQTVKAISVTTSRFVQADAIALLKVKGATEEEIATLYREHASEQVRAVGRAKTTKPKTTKKEIAA